MIYITYIYLPIDAIASKNVVQQNADFLFGDNPAAIRC